MSVSKFSFCVVMHLQIICEFRRQAFSDRVLDMNANMSIDDPKHRVNKPYMISNFENLHKASCRPVWASHWASWIHQMLDKKQYIQYYNHLFKIFFSKYNLSS